MPPSSLPGLACPLPGLVEHDIDIAIGSDRCTGECDRQVQEIHPPSDPRIYLRQGLAVRGHDAPNLVPVGWWMIEHTHN